MTEEGKDVDVEDLLCGLVVRVPGYRHKGPWFTGSTQACEDK
jgi:hypothetical protein